MQILGKLVQILIKINYLVINIYEKMVVVFIFLIFSFGCHIADALPLVTPTPIPTSPTKQVVTTTLPLQEIWRETGPIDTSSGPLLFEVENKNLIVIPYWEREGHKIVVADAQSGNPLWQSNPISNLRSLQADNEQLYAGAITYVQAYDLHTGEALWIGAKQPGTRRGGLYVFPKEENLEVYDFVKSQVYILDKKTGATLEVIQKPNILFQTEDVFYLQSCISRKCIVAVERKSSNEILWQYELDEAVQSWPKFVDNIVYLRTISSVYALDSKTGNLQWSFEGNVADIAFGKGLIYLVRDDAAVVGLDSKTGTVKGLVEMNPDRTYQDDKDLQRKTAYAITASDEFVAIYYGNSNEVIVFERVN